MRVLGINAARETRWADGTYPESYSFVCDELAGDEWRRLGWIMADGSLPHGPLDVVDPMLAQFEYLQPAEYIPDHRPTASMPAKFERGVQGQ